MKRRDFCKLVTGAGVGILVPVVGFSSTNLEIAVPTTADELYLAVNKLFKPHPTISKRSYEDDYRGRHKHITYAVGAKQAAIFNTRSEVTPLGAPIESVLVGALWNTFKDLERKGVTDIWWRELPHFAQDKVFPEIEEPIKYKLYCRCSPYPHPVSNTPSDWEGTITRTSASRKQSHPFHKLEGEPVRYLT